MGERAVISVEEALARLLEPLAALPPEQISLVDGLGRVPAEEILIRTNYVRECIENKEKTKYIKDAIQQGTSQYGMQTFDQSLFALYSRGLVAYEEALRWASNIDEFKLKAGLLDGAVSPRDHGIGEEQLTRFVAADGELAVEEWLDGACE